MTRCDVKVEKDLYVLSDSKSGARAELHPARGALLSKFEVAGSPVLYLDEATLIDPTKNVRGGIPVLFPIAGKLPDGKYRVADREYELKQHGFARNLPWNVVEAKGGPEAVVRCALNSSEETRKSFPFDFEASLKFSLQKRNLNVSFAVKNTGREKLPLHYGLHPYFFVPDAVKRDVVVETNGTRAFDNRTGETRDFDGFDFTQDELDLHVLNHTEKGSRIERPGLPSVMLRWDSEFRVMVVWTVKGKDYVCVEPWTAAGGALAKGGGLLSVAPGSERRLEFVIEVEA